MASGMGVLTLAVDGHSQRVFLGGSAARGPLHSRTTLDGSTGARLRTVDVGPLVGDLLCDTRAGRVLVPSTRGLALTMRQRLQPWRHAGVRWQPGQALHHYSSNCLVAFL